MELIKSEIRNSLFELLEGLLINVESAEHAFENVLLPFPDLNKIGKKGDHTKVRRELSSY